MKQLNTLPLSLAWDEANNALMRGNERLECDTRTVGQMTDVLFDRRFASEADPKTPLYQMYRDMHRPQDAELLKKHGLRYDVTAIFPKNLGREWNKTLGHYHPTAPGSKHSYPELYEVLSGQLVFVLQKRRQGTNEAEDILLVSARAGDKVLVPPDYGHVMVNPSNETLVTANLVEATFKSDYAPVGEKGGMGVFLLDDGTTAKNPAYKDCPEPRRVTADKLESNSALSFARGKNTYASAIETPEKYSFLLKPDELA